MPIKQEDIQWEDAPADIEQANIQWDDESKQEPSLLKDLWESLKAGPTESATQVGMGASAPFALTGWMPMSEKAMEAQQEVGFKDQEQARKAMFGYETQPAQTEVGKILGAGVKAVTDPASYVMGGGNLLQKAVTAGTAGVSGEVGGQVGGAVEQALTGKETGAGRIIGGVTGGLGAGATTAGTKAVTAGAGNYAKQIWDKVRQVHANPEAAADAVAAGSAKRFLEKAATAQGVDDVANALEEFKDASLYVTKQEAPLFFAMSENPVMKAEVVRLAKSSPEARARLEAELNKITKAIDQKAATIFGAPKAVTDTGLKLTSLQKKIQNTEKAIESVKRRFPETASQEDLSAAISSLVEKQKSAVQEEMSGMYNSLKDRAREQGIKMPSEASEAIYTFYKQNRIRDLFGIGSTTEKEIASKLAPTKVANPTVDPNISALERAAGGETATIDKYRTLSFDDVDSLKRLINREQRLTKDPAKLDKLKQFEDTLDTARETYIPEWSQALRDLDAQYFERIGVPFRNAQMVKEIDSAKYASEIAPKIVKTIDGYNQFIRAAGEEGKAIAQNAMLSKAYQSSLTNGEFVPAKLKAFLSKPQNKAILKEMPEVEDQLKNSVLDFNILRGQQAKLNQTAKAARKEIADNALVRLDESSYEGLVGGLLNSTTKRQQFNKQISQLSPENAKAVRESLRSALSKRALSSGDAMGFLSDTKNKEAIMAIMGPGYQEALKKLAIMSDHAAKTNLDKIMISVSQQQMDAVARMAPGLDIPYVTSTLRDRIASPVQKAVRLLSRINVAQTQQKYDALMLDLLTDPEGVKKMAKVSADLNFKLDTPQALRKMTSTVLGSIPPSVYIGAIQGQEDK